MRSFTFAFICLATIPGVRAAEVTVELPFTLNQNLRDVGLVNDVRHVTLPIIDITSVSVVLDIEGRDGSGYNGELFVSLTRGNETAILVNRPGTWVFGENEENPYLYAGYPDNGLDIIVENAAAKDIHEYRESEIPGEGEPLTGIWQPDGRNPLDEGVVPGNRLGPRDQLTDVFHGLDASGDWILTVADHGYGDTRHRVRGWGLIITGETAAGLETVFVPSSRLEAANSAQLNEAVFDGDLDIGGNQPVIFDGPVTLVSDVNLRNEAEVRLTGEIGDAAITHGLSKSGPAPLIIGGIAAYTGTTNVVEGPLHVDGQLLYSRTLVQESGALSGTGRLAAVHLAGGEISPGGSVGELTSGHQTWQTGTILWEINDAAGRAGEDPGWDLLRIDGTLSIEATEEAPVVVRLVSLDENGNSGPLGSFDPDRDYLWMIAETTNGVSGFSATNVVVDSSDFFNDTAEGTFSIEEDGNTLGIRFTPFNEPPVVAGPVSLERLPGMDVKVTADELLAVATDPDGDPLVLASVAETSLHGAEIARAGIWVVYVAPDGFDENDSFTYTISDGKGGEATGTVLIAMREGGGDGVTPNRHGEIEVISGGTGARVRFIGVPGRTYLIQATSDLGGPWETIGTSTADSAGLYEYVEEDITGVSARFYRAVRQ